MKFDAKQPPRAFRVGAEGEIELLDCGTVWLAPDEQVTFRTDNRAATAFDVTRKEFGYYAANSLNGTLPRQGLRAALCRNDAHSLLYMLFVEDGKEDQYRAYLDAEGMTHLGWMDELDPSTLPARAP
ncbi:MAG: hypothetical protein RLW87_03065 [Alphaproteobacteria bacterium]|jgi:hypothetical protein|uniref:hypothetical protein n=1 Tax=Pacificispira sp. TaxID=2888761 RepID=UPI00330503B5